MNIVIRLIWQVLPFFGGGLLAWLWHQQGLTHTKVNEQLNLTVSQQNEALMSQASIITHLQDEIQRNGQLTAQVQQQAELLLGERGRAQKDIKEIIVHELCNTTKLPDAAAVRLRQLANASTSPD